MATDERWGPRWKLARYNSPYGFLYEDDLVAVLASQGKDEKEIERELAELEPFKVEFLSPALPVQRVLEIARADIARKKAMKRKRKLEEYGIDSDSDDSDDSDSE